MRGGTAGQSRSCQRWKASMAACFNPAVAGLWGDGRGSTVALATGDDGGHSGGLGQQLYICQCANVLI